MSAVLGHPDDRDREERERVKGEGMTSSLPPTHEGEIGPLVPPLGESSPLEGFHDLGYPDEEWDDSPREPGDEEDMW